MGFFFSVFSKVKCHTYRKSMPSINNKIFCPEKSFMQFWISVPTYFPMIRRFFVLHFCTNHVSMAQRNDLLLIFLQTNYENSNSQRMRVLKSWCIFSVFRTKVQKVSGINLKLIDCLPIIHWRLIDVRFCPHIEMDCLLIYTIAHSNW